MQGVQGSAHILNNRYKLLERVGSGGMAAVYKSQDLVLGRLVAVKLLHVGFTGDEVFLGKFRKEAHSVANLAHPNIVTVHDIGEDGDRHYIVMEFVEGNTLKQLIRQQPENRPISISRALDLTIQICAGLGYAHRAALVHCDMKPQNILVTPDERVKVTDFGIARALSEATQQNTEQVWGTPQYFSPEQAMGEPASPASDVYSLGIILFELLTGKLPFYAESHTALALKHMNEPPPAISDLNPLVPPQLEDIVYKVLSKEPSARYRTAGQFGRILSTYRKSGYEETGRSRPIRPIGQTTIYHRHPAPPPAEQLPEMVEKAPIYAPEYEADFGSAPEVFESVKTEMHIRRSAFEPAETPSPPAAMQQSGTDWMAVSLGVIAFFALLGLIPLWYLVAVQWGVF